MGEIHIKTHFLLGGRFYHLFHGGKEQEIWPVVMIVGDFFRVSYLPLLQNERKKKKKKTDGITEGRLSIEHNNSLAKRKEMGPFS